MCAALVSRARRRLLAWCSLNAAACAEAPPANIFTPVVIQFVNVAETGGDHAIRFPASSAALRDIGGFSIGFQRKAPDEAQGKNAHLPWGRVGQSAGWIGLAGIEAIRVPRACEDGPADGSPAEITAHAQGARKTPPP